MEYGLVVLWLVAFAGLAALAAPATAALFPRFPGRGAGLAVPVALAVLGVVAFWVGRLAFGYPALVAGLLVLGGLSALALYRGVDPDWRAYGETTAVFAVAFLFLVAVRALDPAVHPGGGEKFLDFGLLASLYRAGRLPPEDVWFAGEPVQYYYGGHMLATLLGRLTVTAPRYAYNLALAGFYATLVTAVYALAGAVAASRGWPRRSGALFGAVLAGVASNLLTPARLVVWAVGARSWLLGLDPNDRGPDDLLAGEVAARGPEGFTYWSASRVVEGTINEFPLFAFLNGDLHAHMMSAGLVVLVAAVVFAYWRTPADRRWRRRAIAFGVLPALAGLLMVVNTWSFPTVLGLAWLGLLFAPADPATLLPAVRRLLPATDGRLPVTTDGGSAAETGGATPTDRTPDWPGAVAGELRRVALAAGLAGVVGVLGLALVAPFVVGTTSGRSIGLVADRSSLLGLALVHGVFLAVSARYLLARADPGAGSRAPALALVAVLAGLLAHAGLTALVPFVVLLAVGWALLRVRRDGTGGTDGAGGSGDGADAAGRSEGDADRTVGTDLPGPVGFETLLVVGAVGIVLVDEFLFVAGRGNPTRFNTVFKTYADVWLLWSTATAAVLARYADPAGAVGIGAGDGPTGTGESAGPAAADGGVASSLPVGGALGRVAAVRARLSGAPVSLGGVLAALLVVSTSLYGGFAMSDHRNGPGSQGAATLDALAFVERDHSTEAAAIAWLRDRQGQPNIVTAPTLGRDMYRWSTDRQMTAGTGARLYGGSAPASLTGVPTLAGWHHEVGYRGQAAWDRRVEDVRTIYDGTPRQQVRHLRGYRVEYVYVGPVERQRYDGTNLADRLTGVSVAYGADDPHVTIYRVDRDRLGVAGDSGE